MVWCPIGESLDMQLIVSSYVPVFCKLLGRASVRNYIHEQASLLLCHVMLMCA